MTEDNKLGAVIIGDRSYQVDDSTTYADNVSSKTIDVIASLEEVVGGVGGKVFLASNVFADATNQLLKNGSGNIDYAAIEGNRKFNSGIAQILVKYQTSVMTRDQITRVRVSKDAEAYVSGHMKTKLATERVPGWERAFEEMQRNQETSTAVLEAMEERVERYVGKDEKTFLKVRDTIGELDRTINPKKDKVKSLEDAHLVASVLTRSILAGSPSTLISNDQETLDLLRSAYELFTLPVFDESQAVELRTTPVRESRFSSGISRYVRRVISPAYESEWHSQDFDVKRVADLVEMVRSVYNSHGKGAEGDVDDIIQAIRGAGRKGKRVTIRGSSYSTDEQIKPKRGRERDRWRDLRKRRLEGKGEESDLVEDGITYEKPKSNKQLLREHIERMIPKYTRQDRGKDFFGDQISYGFSLASTFLDRKNTIERKAGNNNEGLWKEFVEYGFFLRSLYGDSAAVYVDLPSFIRVLGSDGKIDWSKASHELDETKRELGVEELEGPNREAVIPRFGAFIDYRLSTTYRHFPNKDILRAEAQKSLEEAVTKYNLNENNFDTRLKTVLQHIEFGMRQGYHSARRTATVKEMEGL
ncbi:MAG: hypothetical protein AABX10_03015 [Nanoarchaeota archaeon]